MLRACLLFLGVVLSLTANAQTAVRVRGVITAVDGNVLSVRSREGQDLKLTLAPSATFAYMRKLSLADVQAGTPLGTSAVKGPDGKLIARELHLFNPDRPIPNEGHRPWDLEPGSTMTNAKVTATAQGSGGREITLTYPDGAQQVIVPEGTPVVMAVETDRSQIPVGEYAVIAATLGADDKLTATRVQFTRDGVRPPQ